MKLSKKGEYALRSMINLGIAAEVGRSLVQASELAAREQLPVKFLEQILQLLKEHGFVESERGKYGGYRLARPTGKITIGQVIRVIDGPLAPIGCVSQSAYERCSCPDEEHCGLRMLMLDVRNAIAGILDRYTLADIVEVTLRKLRRDGQPLPFAGPVGGRRSSAAGAVKVDGGSRDRPSHASSGRAARLDATEGVLHQLLGDYTI